MAGRGPTLPMCATSAVLNHNGPYESLLERGGRFLLPNRLERDERSMNMSLLHADGGSGGRYGQFRLGDDELVVYDRENASAWVGRLDHRESLRMDERAKPVSRGALPASLEA